MIFARLTTYSCVASMVALALVPACSGGGKEDESASGSTTDGTTASTTEGMTTTTTTTTTTTAGTASGTESGTATAGTTTTMTTSSTGETTTGTTGDVCPFPIVDGSPGFMLTEIADGFDRPLLVRADPEDPDRLFVVEQGGHIKILEPGMTSAPAADFLFIDVKNAMPVSIGPEQGLLGFAFHPDFPDDPRVYVNYNPGGGGVQPTMVDEFKLDANDPNKVDPGSRRNVIAIHQPAGNHNGGTITFGADGYLYLGMGDGGGADDAFNTGRDPGVLLAKILRIGVEPDGSPDMTVACDGCPTMEGFDYTIPADNPFVGDNTHRPEIWAMGMRNPWRFDFDRESGLLYCADVGQNLFEEINIIDGGGDYGWSDMEGLHCFAGAMCDESAAPGAVNADGMTMPISEYGHSQGRCSVTGGYVYRGCEVPAWDGLYFYSDYCTGEVWGLSWDGQSADELGVIAQAPDHVFGAGIDGHGRPLFTTVEIDAFKVPVNGRILRVDPM